MLPNALNADRCRVSFWNVGMFVDKVIVQGSFLASVHGAVTATNLFSASLPNHFL